jgi:hypothetical protein
MQNLPDKARSLPRRRSQAARSGRRLYPSARPGPASAGRRARGDLPPAQGPTAGHRPAALPRQRAQGRAVSQALSELGKQYPQYYRALYEQELERARSEPAPIRRGRPPGGPRPTLAGIRIVGRDMAPGEPGRKPAEPTDPRRPPPGRARGGPAPRRRTVRQRCRRRRSPTGSAWPGRPRSAGAPVGGKPAPQRCEAVGPADVRRFPIANCRRSRRPAQGRWRPRLRR